MSQCANPDCPNCKNGSDGTYVPDGRDCNCPKCKQKRSCSKGQVDDGTECIACGGSTSQSICTTCGNEWEYKDGKCVPAGSGGGTSGGGTSGGGTPPSENVELITSQEIALDSLGIAESVIGLGLSIYLLTYTESKIVPLISALSGVVSISSGLAGLIIKDDDEMLNNLSYVSFSFGAFSGISGAFGYATSERLTGSRVGGNVNAYEIGEGLGGQIDLTHVTNNPLSREDSLPKTKIDGSYMVYNTHFN